MDLLISLDGQEPIYRQIYGGIRSAILEGRLAPSDRLPSTRSLAERLDVSRTVVLLAYNQLRAEGYIDARTGSGSYVAQDLPERMLQADRPGGPSEEDASAPPPHLSRATRRLRADPTPPTFRLSRRAGAVPYDFLVGRLSRDDFPIKAWRRTIARRARGMPTDYGPSEGHEPLRREIAAYLRRARAVNCADDQVIVVNGAREAIDIAVRALVDPGDEIVLEEPHYVDARYPMVAAGGQLLSVPVDEDGMDVSHLPRRADRVRLAYVTPSHQFPVGGIMPLARRIQLLRWARRSEAYVLEDDYDAEFQYETQPIESLQALDRAGRVIYVGTFSKVLSPDLRLGYMVVPRQLLEPLLQVKWLSNRQSPLLLQAAVAEFMGSGGFDRHLRRTRTRHAARREVLLEAIGEHLGDRVEVTGANAGLHVLVWIPGLQREGLPDLVRDAAESGVRVLTVEPHYLSRPPRAGLLLGYAALDEPRIREGVRRLARVISRHT